MLNGAERQEQQYHTDNMAYGKDNTCTGKAA
jgi:hypothetical protein